MSDIKESYKYTIIGHIVNSGSEYLLFHIVHRWRAFELDEEKWALPIVCTVQS